MKRLILILTLTLPTVLRADVQNLTHTLLDSASAQTESSTLALIDSLYPHYLVYGFEVSKSTGIGDVAEIEGAFGVEFHFERKEAP